MHYMRYLTIPLTLHVRLVIANELHMIYRIFDFCILIHVMLVIATTLFLNHCRSTTRGS